MPASVPLGIKGIAKAHVDPINLDLLSRAVEASQVFERENGGGGIPVSGIVENFDADQFTFRSDSGRVSRQLRYPHSLLELLRSGGQAAAVALHHARNDSGNVRSVSVRVLQRIRRIWIIQIGKVSAQCSGNVGVLGELRVRRFDAGVHDGPSNSLPKRVERLPGRACFYGLGRIQQVRFTLFIFPNVVDQREILSTEFFNLPGWQLRKNIKLAGSGSVFLEEIKQSFFRRIDPGLGMVDRFYRADDNGDQGRFTSAG